MKTYDVFLFFNEFDVLELRLQTLYDVVDCFVIVENAYTFTGQSKKLYYEENKDRFSKWSDKIRHIIVDDKFNANSAWEMESFQRNSVIKGLYDASPEDLIFLSDCDEIWDPKLKYEKIDEKIVGYYMNEHYYYLNCRSNHKVLATKRVKFKDFPGAQKLREFKSTGIENGGWHFSYINTPQNISFKLKSFAHTEYSGEYFTNESRIAELMNKGKDLFDRSIDFKFIAVDENFPEPILNNPNRWKSYIKDINTNTNKAWEHDWQISVHAYYVNEFDAGIRSSDRLMNNPNTPDNIRFQTQKNSCFYMKPIASYEGVKLIRIDVPKFKPNWRLFNPTIIDVKNKIYGLVRSSNYDIINNINYVPPPEDNGIIKTEWCLVEFNDDLSVSNYRWMQKPSYVSNNHSVQGIEDCRFFSVDDNVYVSSTVCDVAPYNGRPRISMSSVNLDNATFNDITVLQGIDPDRCEKNWMPIQHSAGFPEWVYLCEHDGSTVITTYQDNKNNFKYLDNAPFIGKTFRGSSQLVRYNDGYIGIVHEVAFFENWRRVYYHRLVEFDSEKRMINCSHPFFLKESMVIEFCGGVAWKGDDLLISFGVRDIEPWIAVVPRNIIDNLLRKV